MLPLRIINPEQPKGAANPNRPAVIYVLLQSGVRANGGIASISNVIAHLREYRPIVVTDRDTARVQQWSELGIETHIIPQTISKGVARHPLAALRSYASYMRELRRIIRNSGGKVVHANDPAGFRLALAAAKLGRGVKIALNIRDTLDPGRKPPRMRYRALFAAADHVFYLSKDMADRWTAVAPNAKSRCSVTYSIVDPAEFARAEPYHGDGPPVVLISGLICPKKGQLDFLRNVSPALAAAGIATWLSGDFDPRRNAYMAACAEAAEPLGDMVQFLGYRSDVAELMARASVIAVPSRHEGLVRAMIEAMSCARPVVSFDICSAREILEEQSAGAGTVVDVGDFAAMTEAICRYCTDVRVAAEAAAKGYATASRMFAAEGVASRYEDVYDRLESGR